MVSIARRLITSLAVFVTVTGGVQHVHGQTIVAGPTTTELTGAAGERITIPIGIDMTGAPGIGLGAYRITFSWNQAAYSFVNATGGTFGSPAFNADAAANGVLQFAAASASGANGIFTLANVTLEVDATLSGVFTVVFDELTAASSFQDLLPYLTVTQGSFCGSDVWGDMDGNGQVQSVDAQVVLMHAVGLSVADTTRGDVDPDQVVDPRDALVILSYVVGLDVSAFRVGQPVSQTCTQGVVDAVRILPAAVSLAPGDEFQLTAEVEDSNGVLLGGKNLQWSSDNGAVVLIDSTGTMFAQGPGTATVTAAVFPGVTGTAAVTVGDRHRWIVNPAGAQGQQDEVGSDTYPFSTISSAVAAAGDGDTIFIHVGTYNEPLDASGFDGLVFEGDSGAAGMPTISTPNRAAGTLSGTGKVTLRRLDIAESASGLDIVAGGLEVESISIRSLRGQGLAATLTGTATFRGVSVSGVADYGLAVWAAGKVTSVGVTVSGVDSSQAAFPVALKFVADTVIVDSSEVRGIRGTALATQGAELTRLHRSTISDFEGDGIHIDSGTTLEVSDRVLVERGYGVGMSVRIDTLRMTDVTLRDIDSHALEIGPDAYDLVLITDVVAERVRDGFIAYGLGGIRASVVGSRVSDAEFMGIEMDPDTLLVDQVVIERTGDDAINGDGIAYARIVDSRFLDVHEGVDLETSGYIEILRTAIHGVRGDDGFDLIGADSMLLVNDTVTGVTQDHGVEVGGAHVFRMRDSHISSTAGPGLSVSDVLDVEIVNVTVDSTEQNGYAYGGGGTVHVYNATNARIDSSRIRYSAGLAFYVQGSAAVQLYGNTFAYNVAKNPDLSGSGGGSYRVIHVNTVDSARIRNNTFLNNRGDALYADFYGIDGRVLFDSNSVRGGYGAVYAGAYDSTTGSIEIRDNQLVGDLTAEQYTYGVYAYPIGSLTIEDNVVDSTAGAGIAAYRADTVVIRGNTFTNMDTRSSDVIHTLDVAELTIDGNAISCTGDDSRRAITVRDGGGVISDNMVTDCRYGIDIGGEYEEPAVATVSNNRVIWTPVDDRPAFAIYVQYPLSRVDLLNNYVSGGDFTYSAIYVFGSGSYPFGLVRIVGDTITNAAGTGIHVTIADTAIVDGNVITGLSRGATSDRKAAIWLANTYDSTQVTRNTITNNELSGILFTSPVQNVFVDTNLVTDNADSGMVFASTRSAAGTVFGTLNTVRRNGVGIATIDNNVHLTANNIDGNTVGLYNDDADTVDVTGNWWGDARGPQCDPMWSCDPGSTGDSLTGWTGAVVFWSPPAEAEIIGAPAGAAAGSTPTLAPARGFRGSGPVPDPEPTDDRSSTSDPMLPETLPVRPAGARDGVGDLP